MIKQSHHFGFTHQAVDRKDWEFWHELNKFCGCSHLFHLRELTTRNLSSNSTFLCCFFLRKKNDFDGVDFLRFFMPVLGRRSIWLNKQDISMSPLPELCKTIFLPSVIECSSQVCLELSFLSCQCLNPMVISSPCVEKMCPIINWAALIWSFSCCVWHKIDLIRTVALVLWSESAGHPRGVWVEYRLHSTFGVCN